MTTENTAETTTAPEVTQAIEAAAEAIVAETTGENPPSSQPKKNAVQERINELTREKYEERRRAERAERELEQMKAQNGNRNQQTDIDDPQVLFQRQVQAEVEKKLAERETQTRNETVQQRMEENVEKARAKYADFDEKVLYSNIKLPEVALQAIRESEISGDLMYAIASDPQVVKNLNRMSPIEAIRSIGKMEAKLETLVSGTTPVKPKPPAPPPPITGLKGTATPSINPAKLTMEEYAQQFKQTYRRK